MVQGRFIHFSADNIDINDSTLDGKNTFHATQIAAWQRGPAHDDLLKTIDVSTRFTLHIPEVLENIIHVNINEGTADPQFKEVKMEWFEKCKDDPLPLKKAIATDLAFVMIRQNEQLKSCQ